MLFDVNLVQTGAANEEVANAILELTIIAGELWIKSISLLTMTWYSIISSVNNILNVTIYMA